MTVRVAYDHVDDGFRFHISISSTTAFVSDFAFPSAESSLEAGRAAIDAVRAARLDADIAYREGRAAATEDIGRELREHVALASQIVREVRARMRSPNPDRVALLELERALEKIAAEINPSDAREQAASARSSRESERIMS